MWDKKFIFLFNTIGGSAGGQLYLSAKVDWLKSEGWDVDVFYFDKVPVVLDNLKKFENNYIKNLEFRFSMMNGKEREETFRHIHLSDERYEEIVIESCTIEMALWGEYFASKCEGRHLCYLLNEPYPRQINESIREFLRFKLNQNLLYGITPKNIPALIPEASGEKTTLIAYGCVREASDIELPDIIKNFSNDNFTILSIGRLEKPYIRHLFEEVSKFAKQLNEEVNLIIVGSTKQQQLLKALHNVTDEAQNLRSLYVGELFPLPRKLFEISDVFVGCAGSAKMSFREGLPTLVIDGNDYEGIGILGETTENSLFRNDKEPPLNIPELLKVIYQRKNRGEKRNKCKNIGEKGNFADFSSHKRVIESVFNKEYYPVERVSNGKMFTFIYSTVKKVGGRKLLYAIKKFKQSLK